MTTPRHCHHCHGQIPDSRHISAIYCDIRCLEGAKKLRDSLKYARRTGNAALLAKKEAQRAAYTPEISKNEMPVNTVPFRRANSLATTPETQAQARTRGELLTGYAGACCHSSTRVVAMGSSE